MEVWGPQRVLGSWQDTQRLGARDGVVTLPMHGAYLLLARAEPPAEVAVTLECAAGDCRSQCASDDECAVGSSCVGFAGGFCAPWMSRGSLDKEVIRQVIRGHIHEVKDCYERGMVTNPELSGRVSIQFTVSGTGQVIASVVQSSDLKSPDVEQCIAQAVRRWRFPKPEGGGIVIVTYPFLLRSAE